MDSFGIGKMGGVTLGNRVPWILVTRLSTTKAADRLHL